MLRARYYDAAVGKWISEDPIGFAAGDSNLARYVGNHSPGLVDPSGLDDIGFGDVQPIAEFNEWVYSWEAKVFGQEFADNAEALNDEGLANYLARVTGFQDLVESAFDHEQSTQDVTVDYMSSSPDILERIFGDGSPIDAVDDWAFAQWGGERIREMLGDDFLLTASGEQLFGLTIGTSIVAGVGGYYLSGALGAGLGATILAGTIMGGVEYLSMWGGANLISTWNGEGDVADFNPQMMAEDMALGGATGGLTHGAGQLLRPVFRPLRPAMQYIDNLMPGSFRPFGTNCFVAGTVIAVPEDAASHSSTAKASDWNYTYIAAAVVNVAVTLQIAKWTTCYRKKQTLDAAIDSSVVFCHGHATMLA